MKRKVLATGQFKRPMFYQLRKDEGVKALLRYSGGLNSDALASSLKIQRTVNESQTIIDVNANAILNFSDQDAPLQDGDIVKVDLIRPGITNKVEIRGEVKYPDLYQYREGDKLFDIINRAGGITKNTYLNRAYIFRGAGDSTSLKADKLEVDLTDINRNKLDSKSNVALQPNDIIQIFSVSEFADPVYVEIFGEVRKTGKMRKYGGMTLQDLIYLSGGLRPSAEYGRLEISSVVDIDSAQQNLKPTRTIVKSYSINPNLQLDSASAAIVLKPYDQVFVRKNPTFELQQNIEIKGMVKYPGLYPRLSKSEKISSFIQRAGGFKENANLGGAVLYRRKTENLREKVVGTVKYDSLGRPLSANATTAGTEFIDEPASIDLYNALKHKNSKYDIVLQENDLIFIPEINPFVTVKGIVQSPLKIAYDKEHTHVPYYVDKAGGYGVRPWRRRVFVTYANGRSKRTKNFMFFHFYPRVEEGSFVTVPRRPEGAEIGDIAKSTVTAIVPVLITALILKYTN
jgi:protein involved in polysaccharide export with SLBB domain